MILASVITSNRFVTELLFFGHLTRCQYLPKAKRVIGTSGGRIYFLLVDTWDKSCTVFFTFISYLYLSQDFKKRLVPDNVTITKMKHIKNLLYSKAYYMTNQRLNDTIVLDKKPKYISPWDSESAIIHLLAICLMTSSPLVVASPLSLPI